MSTPVSDQIRREELVRALDRVARGDAAALRLVYERTSAKLFGICLRICREAGPAEDVLQEVFLKIWRSAHRFDAGKASAMTWLCTIARNSAIDWARANQPRAMLGEDAALAIADDRPSAIDIIEGEQQTARIWHCLDELEDHQNKVIRAAFFEGLSYPDLAAAMETPLGTIKSWVRRGLMRLRRCLGDD